MKQRMKTIGVRMRQPWRGISFICSIVLVYILNTAVSNRLIQFSGLFIICAALTLLQYNLSNDIAEQGMFIDPRYDLVLLLIFDLVFCASYYYLNIDDYFHTFFIQCAILFLL